MLATIIRKEFAASVLSYRFFVALFLLYGVVLVGTLLHLRRYEREVRTFTGNVAIHRQELEEAEDRRSLLLAGITIDRRPVPLSVFAEGLEQLTPKSVTVSPIAPPRVQDDTYVNPVARLFRAPDFAYVVIFIQSLLAILLAFDAISGERAGGTLTLVLSHAVPRDTVILGKWIGGYLAATSPLLLSLFSAILLYLFSPSIQVTGEDLVRIALLALIACLYTSLFFGLALLISVRTRQPALSLLAGLFLWVILVPGLPSLVPTLVSGFVETQGLDEVAAEKAAVEREEQARFRAATADVRDRDAYQDAWSTYRTAVRERQARIDDRLRNTFVRQANITRQIARISPAACFQYAATGLARTGLSSHWRFGEDLDRYRTRISTYEGVFRSDAEARAFDPTRIPRFVPSSESLAASLGEVAVDVTLLAVYNVLAFAAAFAAFLRCDVT